MTRLGNETSLPLRGFGCTNPALCLHSSSVHLIPNGQNKFGRALLLSKYVIGDPAMKTAGAATPANRRVAPSFAKKDKK